MKVEPQPPVEDVITSGTVAKEFFILFSRMSKKLNKKDISAPITESFQQLTTRIDSGMTLPEIATNEPFFDTSASQVGSPEQINRKSNPKKLTALQLSSYVQAVSAFKRQIQAMSAASEMFVRSCEALKESCPSTPATQRYMADLDLLIDSTHLICNSHQIWAAGIASDVEEPLIQHLNGIKQQASRIETKNKARIQELTEKLHKEEDLSYKLGKKKQRDLATLQNVCESL